MYVAILSYKAVTSHSAIVVQVFTDLLSTTQLSNFIFSQPAKKMKSFVWRLIDHCLTEISPFVVIILLSDYVAFLSTQKVVIYVSLLQQDILTRGCTTSYLRTNMVFRTSKLLISSRTSSHCTNRYLVQSKHGNQISFLLSLVSSFLFVGTEQFTIDIPRLWEGDIR